MILASVFLSPYFLLYICTADFVGIIYSKTTLILIQGCSLLIFNYSISNNYPQKHASVCKLWQHLYCCVSQHTISDSDSIPCLSDSASINTDDGYIQLLIDETNIASHSKKIRFNRGQE